MDRILIIFHSWGTDESFYKKLVETAPKQWQIIFTPYHKLAPEGNFDKWNEKIAALLKSKGMNHVALLGHSMGGALAINFAHQYPDLVKKLYLIDSEGIYGGDSYLDLLINSIISNRSYYKNHPLQLIKFITRILRRPISNKKQIDFANKAHLAIESSQLKIPTTIIWGEIDRLTPIWQGQELHRLIPNSKFIILKRMNHDWIQNKPELFWNNI